VLAPSQPASLESFQELPSGSNLLAKRRASTASSTDRALAYLRG
jgi:hypothetical protein